MIINRENSTCIGRGFDQPNSFLTYFLRWIQEDPVPAPVPPTPGPATGGAGWFVIDDRRTDDPQYIVVSNHDWNQAGSDGVGDDPNRHDEPHKILKITEDSGSSSVTISPYAFWDADSHTGYGQMGELTLGTNDDGNFNYDFRGGPTFMSIGAFDDSPGVEKWKFFVMTDWEGDSRYLEGPDVAAPIVGAITAGTTNKVVQFTGNNGPGGTPTSNNFTIGKYYYVYDFNRNAVVDYQKCVGKDNDNNTITLEYSIHNFPSGSIVTAYTHRFLFGFENHPSYSGQFKIPYYSVVDAPSSYYIFPTTPNNGRVTLAVNNRIINRNKPNDRGYYYVGNPYIGEFYNGRVASVTGMNRVYGQPLSCFMSLTNGLSQMGVGRTIDSKNYLYMFDFFDPRGSGRFAFLVPDFDSIS